METVKDELKVEKYSSYKDSETIWLGNIPTHWKTLSNKYIFKLKKNQVGKKSSDYVLLSLTLNGVIERDMENPQGKFPAEFNTYQEVKKGDFVFCLFDVEETPRCVGLSNFDGMITGAYTIMEPYENFDRNFLYYFYLNLDADKRLKPLYTGLRNTISKENFFSFKTSVPPLTEQTAIAAFLDRKAVLIDQAIDIKQKQIELLNERRQILIHKAVTRGLDLNVKMKDSGVEWIGEVPEGWEVKKIKDILIEKKYTRNLNLNCGSISYGKVEYKNDESILESTKKSYQEVLKGEFLINPLNLNYDLKSLRIALSDKDVVVSSGYIVLNTKVEINKTFLNWLLHRFDIDFMKTLGSGVRQTLNYNDIAQCQLVTPQIKEQIEIANYIEKNTRIVEHAISLKVQEIEKLKEYKATLINSAVTGKIKVS